MTAPARTSPFTTGLTVVGLVLRLAIAAAVVWMLAFLTSDEVRYRAYPGHYNVVFGKHGEGDIVSIGSSRSQTAMDADILSERFACGLAKDLPITHDISRSMPGLGIQYIMLRDAFEAREKADLPAYDLAMVEYKETNTTFKYHPFFYQLADGGDLVEGFATANLDVDPLERAQLVVNYGLKKSINTLGLVLSGKPAAVTPPLVDTQPWDFKTNVDLTPSQLINSEGLSNYDGAQGQSWEGLPDRSWDIDGDYERRALYYARKIKKLGERHGTRVVFHSIPVYYQPAQSEYVRAQFKAGVGDTLYTPDKAWLSEFYAAGPFGDGGHMNTRGASLYTSWLAKAVFPDCADAVDTAETAFNETGTTMAARAAADYKLAEAIPAPVPVPASLGVSARPLDRTKGEVRASLRELPYPHERYVTLASDVDSQTWKTAEIIQDHLRGELGLRLSDSVFVSQAVEADGVGDNGIMTIRTATPSQILKLIDWRRRGYVDTIHGWGNHNFASTDAGLTISAAPGATAEEAFPLRDVSLLGKGAMLSATAVDVAPHKVSLAYRMVQPGTFRIGIVDGNETTLWQGEPVSVSAAEAAAPPRRVFFDLSTDEVQSIFGALDDLSVVVTLDNAADIASNLFVSNVSLSSRNRKTVAAEMDEMEARNLRFPIFTTHGGAFAGLFGIENLAAMGRAGAEAALQINVQGDRASSDFYWMDLLDDYGMRYILPANRTSLPNTLKTIGSITTSFRFSDGVPRYSFFRYYANDADSKRFKNPSYTSALGYQLDSLLNAVSTGERGTGGVIYTHWGLRENVGERPKTIDEQFNAETLAAFDRLQALAYGGGSGPPIWVAPTVDILQYSRAKEILSQKAVYVPAENRIDIVSVDDPIEPGTFPSLAAALADLAHATFIVADAATARVSLDGEELRYLQRNPVDARGRQSVMVLNTAPFAPVLREIPLSQQDGRLITEGCEVEERRDTSLAQLAIDVTGERCALTWTPARLDNSDSTHLVFATDGPASMGISYTLVSGEAFDFQSESSMRHADGNVYHVIDLDARVRRAFAGGETLRGAALGRGAIRSLTITTEQDVTVSDIGFVRQSGFPQSHTNFVVGGRVRGLESLPDDMRLVMRDEDGRAIQVIEATAVRADNASDGDAVFLFEDKVQGGRIVTIAVEDVENERALARSRFAVDRDIADVILDLDSTG